MKWRFGIVSGAMAVSSALALIHCGSDSGSGDGNAAGDASQEGAASGDAATTFDGGADAGGDGSISGWPPPMRAACASPVVATSDAGAFAGDGGAVATVGVAWSGVEAAVAYVTDNGAAGRQAALQRLDHHGTPLGAPIPLSQDGLVENQFPIAVASDGASFLACWESTHYPYPIVRCAAVPVGGTAAKAGFALTGSSIGETEPTLAFDGVNRALVTLGGIVILDGKADYLSRPSAGSLVSARIAAESPGFVIANDAKIGSQVRKIRWRELASNGEPVGQEQTISLDARVLALAARGSNRVAFVRSTTDEPMSLAFTSGLALPLDSAGSFTTNSAGIVAAQASFATVWQRGDGTFRYRALSGSGAPEGAAVPLTGLSGIEMSFAGVDDGFLLATKDGASVVLTHLGCP